MPRFEVQGKHHLTGKKETRRYDADDESKATKCGWDDGLIVEKTTLIKNLLYTAIPPLSAKDQKFNRIIDAIASIFEKDTKESPKKKKCKYCAMMVPREARICPFCQKKPGTPLTPASAVLISAFIVLFLIMSIFSGGKTPRSTSNDTPAASRTVSRPAPELVRNSPPAARENSGLATTSNSSIACFTESALNDMTKFTVAGDRASFDAYVTQGKCIVMKGGVDVTVMEYPGLLGGTTGFVYRGVKMWTTREGLTNYR